MQQPWPSRSRGGGIIRAMPQQAEGVTDLDKALSAAKEALAQRQQTAERQLQRALKNLPVARVRGAIAHAASQGCAAATLREAGAACRTRDAEAARVLMEAAAADLFNGAAYRAAYGRCASLDLGPACAAAAAVVAPKQEYMRLQLSVKAATSPAAQLSGVFEEAEQLGLTAELQAAKEVLQQRQHAAVAALEAAAARADAGAFASALSTAWLVNARDDEVRAAARLLESRLQQAPEQLPAPLGHDWRLQESPRLEGTTEGGGRVLTSSQVACMVQGRRYGTVQHLNLGLERLRCFGSALAPLTSLVELHAQSNCLTSLSGLESCNRLEVLKVSNNALGTCKGINRLTQLRDVDLSMNRISHLGGLQCSSALQQLKLDDNRLSDLGGCLPSDALTWLSLANNSLTSIQGMEACSLLEHLSIQGNQVASLSGLYACTRLRHLDAGHNRLTAFPSDLPLECLTHLSFHGNRFTYMPALPCMASLEVIYLQDNQISAVHPMHRLPSLRLINLSFNKLVDPATLTAFLSLPALTELYLNGNPLEKDPRYLEQRSRLLPHLEKDHNHARVPYEDLEARLTAQLVASPVAPIALLQWQTTGKGSPFQLGGVRRAAKNAVRDRASSLPSCADACQCMQAHAQPEGVVHHNMLAKRHWTLSQRMAGRVQQRLQLTEAQRESSATAIQSAWRAHVRGRFAREQDRSARAQANIEDRAAQTIQAAVRGWRVRAEVLRAKQARQIAAQCNAEVFTGDEEEAELLLFADHAAELFAATSTPATAWSMAAQPSAFSEDTSKKWNQPSSATDPALPGREHQDIEPDHQHLIELLPAGSHVQYLGESSSGVDQPESVARQRSEDGGLEEWWHSLDSAEDDVSSSSRHSTAAHSCSGVLNEDPLMDISERMQTNWDSQMPNRTTLSTLDELAVSLTKNAKSRALTGVSSESTTEIGHILGNDEKEIPQDVPMYSPCTTISAESSALDKSALGGQTVCSTSMQDASAVGVAAAGMPACSDIAETSGQPAGDCNPQQTASLAHHGPRQPLSNKEMRRQAAIGRVMEEWGFKDWATAETFYKSQQHQLRSTKDSHRRRLLQDPNVRLARIQSKVEALAEGETNKERSMQRGSVRLQSSSSRRHSYAAAYLRMQPQYHQK